MKKCWIVFEQTYYEDNAYIESIFLTKKLAEKYCRSEEFKFNKSQELFLNEETQTYRYLEFHKVNLKEII